MNYVYRFLSHTLREEGNMQVSEGGYKISEIAPKLFWLIILMTQITGKFYKKPSMVLRMVNWVNPIFKTIHGYSEFFP